MTGFGEERNGAKLPGKKWSVDVVGKGLREKHKKMVGLR